MRNTLFAALALTALLAAGVARADEFGGTQTQTGVSAALDNQSANAQDSDPTARDSVRSHGRP